MSRRRQLGPAVPSPDIDGLLCVLRDNLGKADAFISTAEELIERSCGGSAAEGDRSDDSVMRRRNHVAHLVESAKLAVRAAIYAGDELDLRRRDT